MYEILRTLCVLCVDLTGHYAMIRNNPRSGYQVHQEIYAGVKAEYYAINEMVKAIEESDAVRTREQRDMLMSIEDTLDDIGMTLTAVGKKLYKEE